MENNLFFVLLADNEVFDIFDFQDAPEDQKERIRQGINKENFGINITGLKGIGIGSKLVSGGFDNSKLSRPSHLYDENKSVFAFLSNNEVFLILAVANHDVDKKEIWDNAFKTKVTALEISDYDSVDIGDFWDGSKFIKNLKSSFDSPWQAWKKSLGTTRPWHLINPKKEKTTTDIQKNRLDICMSCPELISITNQCKKCGCIMPLKVKLKEAVCPLGKW